MLTSTEVLIVRAAVVADGTVRGPLLVVVVVALLAVGVVGGYLLRRSRMR